MGLQIEMVRQTQDPMPVEGLVVDQSPLPGSGSSPVQHADGAGVASGPA
jgi:hypothetical protein